MRMIVLAKRRNANEGIIFSWWIWKPFKTDYKLLA
jgi:hypothetical protein